jgi:hypothetical protein
MGPAGQREKRGREARLGWGDTGPREGRKGRGCWAEMERKKRRGFVSSSFFFFFF